LTGSYGIGKTSAIILFIQLASHIIRFKIEAYSDPKKREEFEWLV
jgi:hypothetical protein